MKTKLALIIDLPEDGWSEHSIQSSRGFVSVMLKRSASEFVAFINECPHLGRRLDYAQGEFLETPDGLLVCPAHGATFDLSSGFCVEGPCMGQSLIKLNLSIEDKTIYVDYQ